MKLRISLYGRYLALVGALGLAPVACGDDTPGTDEFPCTTSEPDVVMGQETGYEICSEGQRHRASTATCASALPRDEVCRGADPMFPGSCTSDADCTEKPHGQCGIFGQIAECSCTYGCVTDADCGDGQICDCGDPVGRCVRADCTTDADCAGDLLCVAYVSDPGCGGTAFTCQSELDTCGSDADCQPGENCTKIDDHLECQMQACAIGRPFLVAGTHRTADVAERPDWCATELTPQLDNLSDAQRETLAAHWSEIGLMEHASIAAFARFALQLLAAGAPPELLEATHAAMRDETRHARIAFSLASAYAGREVGPGALTIDGALDGACDEDVLRMVIQEGCIGETVAAAEAAEAAEHVTDPVLRTALERIARDEQRHAELAWRYVMWVVAESPELENVVLAEVAAAMRDNAGERELTADDQAWLELGVVTNSVRASLRAMALQAMVMPAARSVVSHRAAA